MANALLFYDGNCGLCPLAGEKHRERFLP